MLENLIFFLQCMVVLVVFETMPYNSIARHVIKKNYFLSEMLPFYDRQKFLKVFINIYQSKLMLRFDYD